MLRRARHEAQDAKSHASGDSRSAGELLMRADATRTRQSVLGRSGGESAWQLVGRHQCSVRFCH